MQALSGYYDGNTIRSFEKFKAKKNQRVIITILDEFIDETAIISKKSSVRGALSAYANSSLMELEQQAWENAVRKSRRTTTRRSRELLPLNT